MLWPLEGPSALQAASTRPPDLMIVADDKGTVTLTHR
jgi:hypothetical protein